MKDQTRRGARSPDRRQRGLILAKCLPLRGTSCLAVIAFLALFARASAETATHDVASICEAAAQQVSRESGVPLSVLRAITLTETGRTRNGAFKPWPWTVNMEGKGQWFTTRRDARAFVGRHFERGARSFDVGCFQINYRWHGAAFASIDEMFDPVANARYAARFLGDLFDEFGDWSAAAGAYHSRTPRFANRYRARFDRIRARLDSGWQAPEIALAEPAPQMVPDLAARGTPPEPRDRTATEPNLYPLLRAHGGARAIGSLVPLVAEPASGRRLIGGPGRG